MRNSTMRFANKLCITIALSLLVVCIASLALLSTNQLGSDLVARAELLPTTTTTLSNGLGLQYGANIIRTTADDYYSVMGSESSVATFSESNMTSVGDVDFVTKPEIVAGATSPYENLSRTTPVYYGLLDEDVNTSFEYSVNISLKNQTVTSAVTITMSLYYSSTVDAGGKVAETEVSNEVIIPVGASNYSADQNVKMIVSGANNAQSKCHVFAKISVSSSTQTVTLSNPNIEVLAESNQLTIDGNTGVGLSISGANRKTTVVSNVYSQVGQEQLASLYVKEGDIITLTTNILKIADGTTSTQEFSPYYAASFGRAGQSCVDWYTYYNKNYTRNTTYLERVEDEQHLYYHENVGSANNKYMYRAYQGITATFYVTSGVTNATTLQIIPRLYNVISGTSYEYWLPKSDTLLSDIENYQITLNVDNTAPSSPKLDPTKTLGLAVQNKEWYTASDSFTLDYEENSSMEQNGTASEEVYAFLVDTAFSDFPTFYDFTPGNGASFTYKAGSQTLTTRRQELGAYSNSANAIKSNLTFNQAGEYGLILYAVDRAGNVSSPTLYTANQPSSPVVKVDARTMNVGAYIKYGDQAEIIPSASNQSKFINYAHAYVLHGATFHDESGNCIYDVNSTQPNNATNKLISVKRGIYVTVRIVMNNAQYSNYSLVRYSVGNDIGVDNPTYTEDKQGNHIFDITFKMNDDLWNLNATSERPVRLYFHRRVDLKLLDDDFTFTYENNSARKITFADRMQAYFATATDEVITIQPKIAIEYFKPVILTISSEFVINENGQTILQGGGSVYVNGVEYDLGEDFNQNDFVRGDIPFIVGSGEYYVDSSVYLGATNDGGIDYRHYELTCYDVNSGNGEGFADAGTYFYRAYVVADDSTHYYGEYLGKYTIKKADPGVLDPFAKNVLTYGQSLGDLVFSSYDLTNTEIPVTKVLAFGGNSYQMVSTGVFGTYIIQVPSVGSDAYLKPAVQTDYEITVAFRPVDLSTLTTDVIRNNYEILKTYFIEVMDSYGKISYQLREGAQTALNYNDVSIAIPVTIVHKSATVNAINTSLEVSYDGYEKVAEAYVTAIIDGEVTYIEDQPLIIEYKSRGADDSTYTTKAPEQAGQYTVRFIIDSTRSNYTSDFEIRDMIISKRELNISVAEGTANHTLLDNEISYGNVSSGEMLTYTYSHTQTATYVSGFYDEGEFMQIGGLLYTYSFYNYAYYDQNSNAIEIDAPSWSEEVDVIGSSYLNAGLYMMRVSINNQNNAGEKYIVVDVKQVRRGDGANLSITQPTVTTSYEIIDLDGTSRGGNTAHLEYGQTLQSMLDVLVGDRGSAKFSPRGSTSQVSVASRFIFETEQQYVERIYADSGEVFEMDTNGNGEKIFPVLYNEKDQIVGYVVRLIWQAGKVIYDNLGNKIGFEPNYNFRQEEFYVSIIVARAKPDFSDYYLSDLTYGQKVSESAFTGVVKAYGYEFTSSDFTMTIPTETLSYIPQGGNNNILCSFTPSESLMRKYVPINNLPVSLKVLKRAVNITFDTTTVYPLDYDGTTYENAVTHTYGKVYQLPTLSITPVGSSVSTQGLSPQFTYLRDYTEGETLLDTESLYEYNGVTYVKLDAITTSTKVGKYYVLAEIVESDTNFKGETLNSYFVIKGQLYVNGSIPEVSIEYGDNISSADFGQILVTNDLNNYNKYFTGTFKVAKGVFDTDGNIISPENLTEFDFDEILGVDLSGEYNVYLVFVPTGSEVVVEEYNNNYRPFVQKYPLRVAKRDLTDQIEVSNLTQQFNGSQRKISATLLDPVTLEELPLVINYPDGNVFAGAHQVEVTVNSSVENYTGYLLTTLNITKAPLTVTNTTVEVVYNATDRAFVPEWKVEIAQYFDEEFTFNITYYNHLGHLVDGLPREVGYYNVKVELDDKNFEELIYVDFFVAPDLKEFGGLEQIYEPKTATSGIMAVTPVYNEIILATGETRPHPEVKYLVKYKKSGEIDDYYAEEVPLNAGTYDVLFQFNERDYVKTYNLTMNIGKKEAVFIVSDRYVSTYLGTPLPIPFYSLPSSVTVAKYYYKATGTDASAYTQDVPTNVGEYDVKIVLDDMNYKGERETLYVINKASLEVKILPYVTSNGGNIPFNTSSSDVEFSYVEGGVIFPYDPLRVILGEWSLVNDVSAYRVGERNVEVSFQPQDDNFESISTTINVNIIQKDISNLITFADDFVLDGDTIKISYEFNGDKIGVTPVLLEQLPYSDNVYYTVTYASTTSRPVNVITNSGEVQGYPVTVTITDANYSGSIDNVMLYITPAVNLNVVLPELKSIKINSEVLDDSYIVEASGGVYIKGNDRAVQGRFQIVSDYKKVMTKANLQPIEIQFIPSVDVNNVSSPRVTAYINVIGADLDLSSSSINVSCPDTKVYYGTPLSNYQISITGVDATIRWENPDQIVNVGDSVKYVLTPFNVDVYNVVTGYTNLTPIISPAEIQFSADSHVILYEGEAVRNAIPNVEIYNQYLGSLSTLTPEQEKVYKIKDYEFTLTSNNPDYVATQKDLGKYLEGITVTLTITHPNYETIEWEFPVFVKRLITEFSVGNKSKYYDGKDVTIGDLDISLVGTNYTPNAEDLIFKSILLDGKEVSSINKAGTYTVTISLMEDIIGSSGIELSGSHKGEFTFTYLVEKRDLSANIDGYFLNALNERVEFIEGTTYAEYVEFVADFLEYDESGNPVGLIDVDATTIVFTHYSSTMAYSYGTLPPTDAGVYKVVVSVQNNPYFTGSKTYDYEIKKRVAEVDVDAGYFYTYSPSGVVNIVPLLSNNVSLDYVQITYYPQGSNVGTTEKPINIGTYNVVINIVNHPNIMGSATTMVTISPAQVVITELPYLNANITYGTPLKHVGIEGGVAETITGDRIDGTFDFAYPELNDLPAGINNVNLIFTPTNSNYGTTTCVVSITVLKASINATFTNLEKFYTGEPLYPDLEIKEGIRVDYTFRLGNLNVPNAIDAGVYQVTVSINDFNYEGMSVGTFTIHKARAVELESTAPMVSPITYGTALKSGTFSGGEVVYVSGKSGIPGTYRYKNEDRLLGDVGVYSDVIVVFTPNDSQNYESYEFGLDVQVVKANAIVRVSANTFTYGESIVSPTFTTIPQGLNVENATFEEELRGKTCRVGTYLYTATIDEKNYQGEITYAIVVNKKPITIAYYREGNKVDSYTASYGVAYYAKAQIVADTLVGEDLPNKTQLEQLIVYNYVNLDTGATQIVPPTKIGNYKVVAKMDNNDYYIDEEYASVNYTVTRATVNSIEFDLESLSNQIYGSVSTPVVITSPSGVGYEIEYPGYPSMPTSVGEYSILVTIKDDNYFATTATAMFRIKPKPISVENLKAYPKAYDGLDDIEVVGELKGVMSGDDVDIKLFAHTRDNKTNVGAHSVVIYDYDLYGLHADNYTLRAPIYNLTTKITNKVITDPNTSSYITSAEGFSSNITVSFQEVYDTVDKTNFLTRLVGQKATVQVITVKENGLNTVLDSKVKFYVLIPEEYKDAKNLTVEGLGNLENAIITREGDYVTFYADSSGEIVFYKNDFPYWVIIVGAIILMLVLGGVFALIALPIRRRKHIPRDARSAYVWNETLDGREHVYRKKVEQEIVEKKRRWRY